MSGFKKKNNGIKKKNFLWNKFTTILWFEKPLQKYMKFEIKVLLWFFSHKPVIILGIRVDREIIKWSTRDSQHSQFSLFFFDDSSTLLHYLTELEKILKAFWNTTFNLPVFSKFYRKLTNNPIIPSLRCLYWTPFSWGILKN